MPFLTVNNIVHRYVDEGAKGRPAIVFANSLGSDLRIWDEVAASLAGDFRESIRRVTVPTLVLCGAEDIATPPELGRELAGLIAGALFSLIENAGHLPCVEQPEQVAQRMKQFFREVAIG
jgi:pimeloyl-ACP methyl ester carboxylesterase